MNKPDEGLSLEFSSDPAGDPRLLAGQLGREIASPLASALQRVLTLTSTGKIARNSLVSLRTEIEQAMSAGTSAQHLCQLIHQGARQRPARLDLRFALHQALRPLKGPEGAEEPQVKGVTDGTMVTADPALVERLMTALAQWALYQGAGPAHWAVESGRMTTRARIVCSVKLHREGHRGDDQNSIHWHLVQALCASMGVRLLRLDEAGNATVTLEFQRAGSEHSIEGMVVEELDPEEAVALYAKTVAGTSLLVVAGRRETREIIHEAVKPLGLISDFAQSVEEAREFCDSGLPHAIVYEPRVRGVPFEPLRVKLLAQAPSLALVEIHDEEAEESGAREAKPRPRAKRQSLSRDLAPLLMNELSRALQPWR